MTAHVRGAVVYRDCCPSCGMTAFQSITREPFDSPVLKHYFESHYQGRARIATLQGHDYELVRCTTCTLAYQRGVPAEHLLTQIYDEWIPPGERDRLRESYVLDDFRDWAEQVQLILQHLRMPPHTVRILDFGMGWAEWAVMAKAFGCQVAGSELSLARRAHARSMGVEILAWNDIPGRKFHFINTEQVVEHLIDPLGIIKHLAGSLDDGGILKISVPNCRSALRKLAKGRGFGSLSESELVPVAPLEHVNCFEYKSLVAVASHAGLRPLRPSIRLIYNGSSGWLTPRRALRMALRPIYRHVFPKSTYVLFVKEERKCAAEPP